MRPVVVQRRPGAPSELAHKHPTPRRTRLDPALEQQADEASARALRGDVGVARLLSHVEPAQLELPSSPGRPLPRGVRAQAEAAFGADFAAVRVHDDPEAWSAAAHEDARGFTAGRDIFFAEIHWRPTDNDGRALLYHELAHVAQQTARRGDDGRARVEPRTGNGAPQGRGLRRTR